MTLGLITLGGTISMTSEAGAPASPTQSGSALVDGLGGVVGQDIIVVDLARIGSPQITMSFVGEILKSAASLVDDGVSGVVVSQGTDTLEETSYLVDLVWDEDMPVVFTGAMRASDVLGADGPANLRDSLLVAADPRARGRGVLVCLGGEVHEARRVRKVDANAPDAFASPNWGPIARISEERLFGLSSSTSRKVLPCPVEWSSEIRIPLLWSALDDDGVIAGLLADLDPGDPRAPRGLVVGAMGSGHVPVRLLDALEPLVRRGVPVVAATRCGAGTTTSGSYGYPGSEGDLLRLGVIAGGWLTPLQARLLLYVLIADHASPQDIREAFADRGRQP